MTTTENRPQTPSPATDRRIVIRPYDERAHAFRPYERDRDRRFVFGTFLPAVGDTPGTMSDSREAHGRALERVLRGPDVRAVVLTPSGSPDELMGWAVATSRALVFVHVAYQYRRGRLGFHYGSALVEAATGADGRHFWAEMHGCVHKGPAIPCALWTRAASRMAAKGFPWRYDLDEHEKLIELGTR